MAVKIGSAPDSWGVWFPDDARQTPWPRFLDEIAQAGYEWTELGPYGYLPTDLPTLKRELDRRNLNVCGTFVMAALEDPQRWPDLEKQMVGAGELLAGLGVSYLVLIDDVYSDLYTGEELTAPDLDDDAWKQLIETTHRATNAAMQTFGLQVVFHPHAETHVEYEPQIERFLADTEPAVKLCLDVGHHAYRGGDPIAFMRKHHQRIPYLHLKSVDPVKQRKVEEKRIPFAEAVAQNVFCEPSEGTIDFPAFRDLLLELNYEGFAVVEQDMYPCDFDHPLPIAARTRKYLADIGLG
jgi:inosose dehydratase